MVHCFMPGEPGGVSPRILLILPLNRIRGLTAPGSPNSSVVGVVTLEAV